MEGQVNGGEPQASVLLTREMLLQATRHEFTLEALSKRHGRRVKIVCRSISTNERNSFLPPLPPEAADWDAEEFAELEIAWIMNLPPDQLETRRAISRDLPYRVLHLALLEPTLTLEEIRGLADDAVAAAVELLIASGIIEPRKTLESVSTQEPTDVVATPSAVEDAPASAS